jgi:hypothetical protein
MTEADWLHGKDPGEMIRWYKARMSPRKFRLFICTCCRSLWDELTSEVARQVIDSLECYAEGLSSEPGLENARVLAAEEVQRLWSIYEGMSGGWRASFSTQAWALGSAVEAAFRVRVEPQRWIALRNIRSEHQCHLLRDIFGNPYQLTHIDPAWLTLMDALVPRLAQQASDERRFDDLPILADALEDVGCTDEQILTHLRSPGPHTRGCWAVDALLGKT